MFGDRRCRSREGDPHAPGPRASEPLTARPSGAHREQGLENASEGSTTRISRAQVARGIPHGDAPMAMMRADEKAWMDDFAWSLKLGSVKPGSSPVLDSLVLAESLKSMNLRLIGDIQNDLFKELGRKKPRASKLDALLKGADIIRRTERILEK